MTALFSFRGLRSGAAGTVGACVHSVWAYHRVRLPASIARSGNLQVNLVVLRYQEAPVMEGAAGQRFRFIPGSWPAALRKEIVIHLPGQM